MIWHNMGNGLPEECTFKLVESEVEMFTELNKNIGEKLKFGIELKRISGRIRTIVGV